MMLPGRMAKVVAPSAEVKVKVVSVNENGPRIVMDCVAMLPLRVLTISKDPVTEVISIVASPDDEAVAGNVIVPTPALNSPLLPVFTELTAGAVSFPPVKLKLRIVVLTLLTH